MFFGFQLTCGLMLVFYGYSVMKNPRVWGDQGLCENNDKFAIDRMLPQIDIGDLVYIHEIGRASCRERV